MVQTRSGFASDTLIRPTSSDRWPRGITCDDGFSILGTPIRFRRARGSGLTFVANVDDPLPRRGQRILLTPFVHGALGAQTRELDCLTLGFDRTIRLGRMDIRLHPAGLGPGSAQLELAFRGRRILYCGGVRNTLPLAAPCAEYPKCDLLLIDVAPVAARPPAPKRAAKQLCADIEAVIAAGRIPAVLCGSWSALFDVAWCLHNLDLPVRACRPAFEALRRVAGLGYTSPRIRRLEQLLPVEGVVLHLASLWPRTRFFGAPQIDPILAGPKLPSLGWVHTAHRFGESEDRAGLVEYARQVAPAQIAVSPRCDAGLPSALHKAGFEVFVVHAPIQMPLPF